jgi:hypothetical protein
VLIGDGHIGSLSVPVAIAESASGETATTGGAGSRTSGRSSGKTLSFDVSMVYISSDASGLTVVTARSLSRSSVSSSSSRGFQELRGDVVAHLFANVRAVRTKRFRSARPSAPRRSKRHPAMDPIRSPLCARALPRSVPSPRGHSTPRGYRYLLEYLLQTVNLSLVCSMCSVKRRLQIV